MMKVSKEKLKTPPVFECFVKFVSLDNSRVEIIPTHSYIAENGRVEFTFKVPNSYFGEQSNQISDLEAKLAESEESCMLLEGLRKSEAEKKDIAMKRVAELKQQLAEKDEEIESLKIDIEAKDFNINTLMEQRKRHQKFYNQDKISFAVEQLEKVADTIYSDMGRDVYDIIVCQIKQLKEMK